MTTHKHQTTDPGLDVRLKLAGIVLLSLSLAQAQLLAVGLAIAIEAALIFWFLPHLKTFSIRLRPLWLLLVLVFTARVLAAPGIDLLGPTSVGAWRAAVNDGLLVCGRLLAVILLSLLLVGTTRTRQIRSAVVWFFKPIPLVPERRVATLLSLLLRFIPLIIAQSGNALDAQRARGVEQIKNPVRRLLLLVLPLAQRTFITADRMAEAMEARCYAAGQQIAFDFNFTLRDGIAAVILLLICAMLFWPT